MSLIQKIRDKYARWAVVAIALSLLGFILMDALSGRANLFGGNSTTIGSVDGKEIEFQEYNVLMDKSEQQAKAQGYEVTDENRQQMMQQVWNERVNELVLEKEYEALGLYVSDKEFNDMLFGDNPPQDLKQAFTDSTTGVYDINKAQTFFNELKTTKDPQKQEQKTQVNEFLVSLRKQRLSEKYNSLLNNSVYIPKWYAEKKHAENSMLASVSYVAVPYSSIADSTVKVTDEEITDYIKDRSDDFQQKEESRSISYVLFNVSPSAKDSAEARDAVLSLKTAFDTATNYTEFTAKNNSRIPFTDSYVGKNAIQQVNKDSILAAPVGVVYGPYLDGSSYTLSKIIGVKQWPDTVKVRHLLVAFQQRDPQTQQVTAVRDDSTAKKLIDSLAALHKSGTSFDTLVAKFSDDPGSKDKGGVYDSVTVGGMVPPFNDFIFSNKTGSTGVVKTDFGYHYIEVLSQKGSAPAYKIAYMAREIKTGKETEDNAYNAARMFRAASDDLNEFNANADKDLKSKGINKLIATDITSVAYAIQGVGTSRDFVRAIFDADRGDVLGPEKIGSAWVVAAVTDIEKEGLQSVNRVRRIVEPILLNKKKAEQIKKNIGPITTLEEVAAKIKQPVQSTDSLIYGGSADILNQEVKVVGAAFNPANKGKVVTEPIAGQSGVYVIKVNSTGTRPPAGTSDDLRKLLETQTRQGMGMQQSPANILRKAVDVKDKRSDFY